MKFSIIIPVYNVENYLKACLDSVVNQNYKNYEVIIVCDKCNDKSEEIVDFYVKKYKNFKKIYAENTGLSKARNIGISNANGDYILFLDSDDYFEEDILEVLKNAIDKNTEIVRFQAQEIKDNNIIKYNEEGFITKAGVDAFQTILKYHFIENAWLYCYKMDFYKKNKFTFKENCIAEDYGLIPLIIAKAKYIKSISYIGYNYVQRKGSLMSNTNYEKKVKKMNDMLLQAKDLSKKIKNIKSAEKFIYFINNSLICYVTSLKYKDYKLYNKVLKEEGFYKHLKSKNIKSLIKNTLIKINSYYYYNFRR